MQGMEVELVSLPLQQLCCSLVMIGDNLQAGPFCAPDERAFSDIDPG